MDSRVNCMSCLCDDGEGVVPGVVTQDDVTHALAVAGLGSVFRLCDFDRRSGVLLPGRWPGARISEDDRIP